LSELEKNWEIYSDLLYCIEKPEWDNAYSFYCNIISFKYNSKKIRNTLDTILNTKMDTTLSMLQ